MKKLMTIILVVISTISYSQNWTPVSNYGLRSDYRVGIGMNPQVPNSLFDYGGKFYLNGPGIIVNNTLTFTPSVGSTITPVLTLGQQNASGNLGSLSSNNDGVLVSSKTLHLHGVHGLSLDVSAGSYATQALFVDGSGNIGIHQTSPLARFHVRHIGLSNEGTIGQVHGILIENDGWRAHDYALEIRTGHGKIFDISNSGHMHLGKNLNWDVPDADDYRLYVEDGIRTEQIKVDIAADNGWADYVFKEDYSLRSLDEVEFYINENKHLPDVPSAEEMVKNGLNVAEMDALLLRKIEELTLYVIDLKKQNNVLQQQLNNLKTEAHED